MMVEQKKKVIFADFILILNIIYKEQGMTISNQSTCQCMVKSITNLLKKLVATADTKFHDYGIQEKYKILILSALIFPSWVNDKHLCMLRNMFVRNTI